MPEKVPRRRSLRGVDSAHRVTLLQPFAPFLDKLPDQIGVYMTGADAVHADVLLAVVDSQVFGELNHASL